VITARETSSPSHCCASSFSSVSTREAIFCSEKMLSPSFTAASPLRPATIS
jgi:hypothetical protein